MPRPLIERQSSRLQSLVEYFHKEIIQNKNKSNSSKTYDIQ